MSDSQSIKYLKQDHIGKVIAKGLANVYQNKPSKPITYFANWLLNYSQSQKQIDGIRVHQESKKVSLTEHHALHQAKNDQVQLQTKTQKEVSQRHSEFQQKIKKEKYHMELLLTQLPQFLEKSLGLTGVYVGELNHPSKAVTQQDTDDNAHLVLDGPKLIKYVGSSISHKDLMIGNTLPTTKGVTADVFVQAPAATVQDGVQVTQQKPKYIYVPDVVQNQKIHYFRLPKLGAYIAVPLICKSYLSQGTLDFALEETKKQAAQRSQFQKEKSAQLQEFKNELQEAKHRLQISTEKNEQALVQSIGQQVKQLESKIESRQAETLDYSPQEVVSQVKEFVVCGDTLGQDREMTVQDREFFLRFVELFKNQWEEQELDLLRKDVACQIKYEQSLRLPPKDFIEELSQNLENIPEDVQTDLNSRFKDQQNQLVFETQAAKLEVLRGWVQREEVQQSLMKLKDFRVVKFPGLIQNLLYLLGFKKQQVDIKGTTHLNWKFVRHQLINQGLLGKISNYKYRGPKNSQFRIYEKVQPLAVAFERFPEEQVFEYNIGLGVVLRYVKAALKLRKQDVQIRKVRIEEMKKQREEKEQENQKIQEQKQQALQKHRSTLPPEEIQEFDEAQWLQVYQQDHPFTQIPAQVQNDIDNDI